MNNQEAQGRNSNKNQASLVFGTLVLIIGFLSPLLIPFVIESELSPSASSIISGLLAFGIPELFMIVGVALMGKRGYQYLKEKTRNFVTLVSPQRVSKLRYRIGVILFVLPITLGLLQPYLAHYIPFFLEIPLLWIILTDLLLLVSLFVLGGDFWEKLKGLFHQEIVAVKRP